MVAGMLLHVSAAAQRTLDHQYISSHSDSMTTITTFKTAVLTRNLCSCVAHASFPPLAGSKSDTRDLYELE